MTLWNECLWVENEPAIYANILGKIYDMLSITVGQKKTKKTNI